MSAARAKLDAVYGRVNLGTLTTLVMLAGVATGCFRPARAIRDLPAGDWTHRLGNARHAPFIDERVPAAVQVAWSADLGRGVPVTPIVQEHVIISAVSGGGIVTASSESGERYWRRRFNAGIAGQVLRVDSRVYFATQHRNGTMYALDLTRGRRIWSRRIGAPASAEPAYAEGMIYVPTQHGELIAIDAESGDVAWRIRTGSAAVQPPVALHDDLIITARDTLLRIDRARGTVRSRHVIAGAPSAPLALRGDTIVIAMHPGIVAAYADAGARELWRHDVAAPVLAAPVIADSVVFVLTRSAELLRLDPRAAVHLVALDGSATESLTVTADGALIGTLDGRVTFVRRDGTIVWEKRVAGSVRAPAAVHDSAVYVGTLRGSLVKLTTG